MYHNGMSIEEIATSADRSYTYVRNNLLSRNLMKWYDATAEVTFSDW